MQPIVNQWVISPKKPHTKTQICLTSKAGNTFCTRSHKMYILSLRHFYRRLNTRNLVVHFVFCPFLQLKTFSPFVAFLTNVIRSYQLLPSSILLYDVTSIPTAKNIGDFLAISHLSNKRDPVISAASIFHPNDVSSIPTAENIGE